MKCVSDQPATSVQWRPDYTVICNITARTFWEPLCVALQSSESQNPWQWAINKSPGGPIGPTRRFFTVVEHS